MSLNPRTQVQIQADKSRIAYIAGQLPNLTYMQVLSLVDYILSTALDMTINDCKKWIENYVPRRTGQLQDTLLQNLESSRYQNGFLKLVLGTHLNYAEYVNRMSEYHVRHSGDVGYAYYYGYHGKMMLNDPKAVGHYHGLMLMYARERLRQNFKVARQNITGAVGVSGKPFSDKLKVIAT